MTEAGWYPVSDNPMQERYFDGSGWTTAYREASSPAPSPGKDGKAQLTAAGKFVQLAGLALLGGGLYVGFGVHSASVGVDGTSLADLAGAHSVDCGAAFHVTYNSPLCDQALSGKKTTAIVLLIVGGTLIVGAGSILKEAVPAASQPATPGDLPWWKR